MKLAVGIDIGGTITKIGLVSEDGKCIKKTSFRTKEINNFCLLYTSPSPRDKRQSRMPSSA